MARQQQRRQRRERVAGGLLAVVGVVVLVVAIVALNSPKSPANHQVAATQRPTSATSSTSSSASATPSATASTSPHASSSTSSGPTVTQLKKDFPLVVLNNTTTQGLAAAAAQRFEQNGWTVSSTGNLVNNILSTCAYYDPSVANAEAAAQALQREFPSIVRVEPRFDGLNPGPVVVVLTTGYSTS